LKQNRKGGAQRMVRCAFTASEARHILSLIACNERNGEHTAPQEQYWKRSERIKAKLASIADRTQQRTQMKQLAQDTANTEDKKAGSAAWVELCDSLEICRHGFPLHGCPVCKDQGL
jgi:hypothetical protein